MKDLLKVTGKILSQFKDQKDRTEDLENVLNRIDGEVDTIMREQKGMKGEEIFLKKCIEEISNDFEDHWKLIQQVIKENKNIGEEVIWLKKIDIPAIRNFIINRSNVMTNPLGQSNTLSNNFGVSAMMQNQLQVSNTGNTGNFVDSSKNSSNQPQENVKEEFLQESTQLRIDGSLCSNDFHLGGPGNESNLGVIYQTSLMEDIQDGESGRSENSDNMS